MAIPVGVVAKKVAVAVSSDKRSWKVIVVIIISVFLMLAAPVFMFLSLIGSGNNYSLTEEQIIKNLPPEKQSQIMASNDALAAIEKEAELQGVSNIIGKAKIIYLSALVGKEKDDTKFFKKYIACFVGTKDNNEIFQKISNTFGVTFSDEDITKFNQIYPNK